MPSSQGVSKHPVLSRREFLIGSGRRGAGVVLLGGGLPALLAACGGDEPGAVDAGPTPTPTPTPEPAPTTPAEAAPQGDAIVGDVVDFALESDEWAGAFGFVTFRLHRGLVDGADVYYIRTDASDADYAGEHGLVEVPRLAGLAGGDLVGRLFLPADDADEQPPILSTEPGREDYTPAWQVQLLRWTGDARPLGSVADVEAAEADGALEIDDTGVVVNFPVVKWSSGELPVDDERTAYLGPGQLLEPPDVDGLAVTFKLHECFPASWYIVTDTDLQPMAEGMQVGHSPRLAGTSAADATGRTNVFMNGIEGPGPMGFQPSVFDTQAGDPEWSPYWDHMTYAWADGADPRVLTTEAEIHAARDAGELEEFPGVPDTEGEIFVVNCPVPVIADNVFTG